ncbi:MAG: DUF1428 domain-containing protein [Salaquimonas sp.]|jgi:uncharacterized protein YbaA (DUF1428 family)|nr:DUF1428 domain-containing protein [Salaquimonas sp.]
MTYVDGVVVAVATDKRELYIEKSKLVSALFREYGALRVVDTWGVDVPDGKFTSFPMAVKREPHETVVFGWVEWPSRAVRDEAWEKVMKDERMTQIDLPFDGKRMIFGGFEMIVDV